MSQENVELAARLYQQMTSKAKLLSAMPRILEFCHPEVEWTTREDGLTYRGPRGGQGCVRTMARKLRCVQLLTA
jgi:hypothetical protein